MGTKYKNGTARQASYDKLKKLRGGEIIYITIDNIRYEVIPLNDHTYPPAQFLVFIPGKGLRVEWVTDRHRLCNTNIFLKNKQVLGFISQEFKRDTNERNN